MSTTSRKATVYFDPSLHDALRERAATDEQSISALVNDAVRAYLDGDATPAEPDAAPVVEAEAPGDEASKPKRSKSKKKKDDEKAEKTIPFKRFVKKLKARGKL